MYQIIFAIALVVYLEIALKAITEIFNELSAIGDDIDDTDRLIYLLASLPNSYEMLVTALEANIEVPNMETVVEQLLHEERK